MKALYAGPFSIQLHLESQFTYEGWDSLCGFSKGDSNAMLALEVKVQRPQLEFNEFREDSHLAGNWRVQLGTEFHRVQFWCDEEKRFVLEAQFSVDFTSLELRSLLTTPRRFHVGFLLSSALKWMVIHRLPLVNGFMLHGACLNQGAEAWIATGPSGAGKSTLSSLFLGRSDFAVLTDETVILLEREGKWWAYGSPWPGMLEVVSNRGLPLRKLFFLEKSMQNRFFSLRPEEVFPRIWSEVFVPPAQVPLADLTLSHVEHFLRVIPVEILAFRKDRSIVEYVTEVL